MEKPKMKMPIIIKKENITYINVQKRGKRNIGNFRKIVQSVLKDTVLYETDSDNYFLEGKYQCLRVFNQFNLKLKVYRTVARYVRFDGSELEKTSDNLVELIGQDKYKTVLSGLCSIIDNHQKIRSILALLAEPMLLKRGQRKGEQVEKCCQTDEIRNNILKPHSTKRIKKRRLLPYIVQDSKCAEKKFNVVVDIQPSDVDIKKCNKITERTNIEDNDSLVIDEGSQTTSKELIEPNSDVLEKSMIRDTLPDLGNVLNVDNEDSNDSVGCHSSLSVETTLQLLEDPLSMINNIDKHTQNSVDNSKPIQSIDHTIIPLNNTTNQNTYNSIDNMNTGHRLKIKDGYRIVELNLPCKPEDDLHIATKSNMQTLNPDERRLLIKYQMTLDLKHCMTAVQEDSNFPIHLAVLNDDFELVKRQCIVLNLSIGGVDVVTKNDLTPLKMSLYRDTVTSTCILLQHGADVLRVDTRHRTPVHCAAELPTDHLAVLLNHCKTDARKILTNSDITKPEWAGKTDDEMEQLLLNHICCMTDDQGYTALMLAARLGQYDNVRTLVLACRAAVDRKMPTSGNTALYLACAAAADTANGKSKVPDKFEKTINILMEHNADPSVENFSGASVITLLSENNLAALSMLVNNTLTKTYQFDLTPEVKDAAKMMLVKNENGDIDLQPLDEKKQRQSQQQTHIPVTILKDELLRNKYKTFMERKNVTVTDVKAGKNAQIIKPNEGNKTVRKIINLPPQFSTLKRNLEMPQKIAKKGKK